MDNFRTKTARRRAVSLGWGQPRLFELPVYLPERSSMHERLVALAADLVALNGGVATRRTMKTVENHMNFLDKWIRNH